jgi:hypothetical protein
MIMAEPKPMATLSSNLLARKGHAKPAMRPQNYSFAHTELDVVMNADSHDDLGWNDMGHDEARAEPTPIHNHSVPHPLTPPPVVIQQAKLVKEFTTPAPVPPVAFANSGTGATRAAPGSKGKSAFTLRLDGERHLRLRLVCAVKHRSAQQIVTQALDEFLERHGDLDRFTAQH